MLVHQYMVCATHATLVWMEELGRMMEEPGHTLVVYANPMMATMLAHGLCHPRCYTSIYGA